MKSVRISKAIIIIVYLSLISLMTVNGAGRSIGTFSLNGKWEIGSGRIYTKYVNVPGIHTDPASMNTEKLWYRREVILPEGTWKYATLELKGARFLPEVFVNGVYALLRCI